MYIRYDAHIDQPAEAVRRELLDPPERWLPAIVDPLAPRRFRMRVGFAAGPHVTKEVELTLGAPEAPGQWLVIPVTWRATGPSQLFPALDGKLTVQPRGPHSSTLWMGATYQPPLGAVGQEVDDLVMHGVAEATIKDFVERIAVRLGELAANRPA
jgi:hypothetical protein